jgi:chromosome segregation ATPase
VTSRLDRLIGARDEIRQRRKTLAAEVRDLEEQAEELELVSSLFRSLIDDEIATAVTAVEKLLSDGLGTIFDDQKLSVEAEVRVKRNKVDLTVWTVQEREGGVITKGLARDCFGGSVATVESLLMRVLVLLKRGLRPVLILDEALAAFDPRYAERIGEFLSALCDKLGMDILMVTHNPTLFQSAQRAYRVRQVGEQAKLELVKG